MCEFGEIMTKGKYSVSILEVLYVREGEQVNGFLVWIMAFSSRVLKVAKVISDAKLECTNIYIGI